jgi:addiction module HigA family antidote
MGIDPGFFEEDEPSEEIFERFEQGDPGLTSSLPSRNPVDSWSPPWVVPPGEILREALAERHITQRAFARTIGRSNKMVNQLLGGRVALTPRTALLLEEHLGISARFWLALEAQYQLTYLRASRGKPEEVG